MVVIDPGGGVAADGNRRNAKFLRTSAADERKSPLLSLAQRSKEPSVGNKMATHSSSGGLPRTAPEGWPPRAIAELKVGPA